MREGVAPTKISHPRAGHVVPRKRLFALLDEAAAAPLTWVSAPPGAGKTVLAASYASSRRLRSLWYQVDGGDADPATFFYYLGLAARHARRGRNGNLPLFTPEYLGGAGIFARRFMEKLCAQLGAPALLVFDDYHALPEDAVLHGLLAEGVAAVPPGVRVLVLSRADPPPVFARLQAASALHVVDGAALRLTEGEAAAIARQRLRNASDDEAARPSPALLRQAQGWAAGLVLLLEHAHRRPDGTPSPAEEPPAPVFDYFAQELFAGASPDVQAFMLRTAVPPTFTPAVARALTGQRDVGGLLDDLLHRNLFILRLGGGAYRFHPLLRAFLLHRARQTLAPSLLTHLHHHAGRLLAREGRAEEAAELFRAIGDWPALAVLVRDHAPALLNQGRFRTLQDWLAALPAALREADPWLLYWHGLSLALSDPLAARQALERAFALHREADDVAGTYLAWAGVVESHTMQWDDLHPLGPWLQVLSGLRAAHPNFPGPEVEARVLAVALLALLMYQPRPAALAWWVQRARDVVHAPVPAELRVGVGTVLIYYDHVYGDFRHMQTVVSALEAVARDAETPPLARIMWHYSRLVASLRELDLPACHAAFAKGIRVAEDSGVHLVDTWLYGYGVYAALLDGDPAEAERRVERQALATRPTSRIELGHVAHNRARLAYAHGDLDTARRHAETSLEFSRATGAEPPIVDAEWGLGLLLAELDRFAEAQAHLRAAMRLCRLTASPAAWVEVTVVRAYLALRRGRLPLALRLLRRGFGAARDSGYYLYEWYHPRSMGRLCALALRHGIEPGYVRELIVRYRIPPPPEAGHAPDAWLWPVSVALLGRVRLHRDGRPVEQGRKGQRRPLALLHVLVALGGRDVPLPPVVEALWPDAEGDAALRALHITLHRLRELVGSDAVRLAGGRMSLNPALCWTDVGAFEALAARAEAAFARADAEAGCRLADEALALYRGPLLGSDEALPPVATARRRLERTFVRLAEQCAEALLSGGQPAATRQCYLRALEAAPLSERLYRGLMRVCIATGEPDEAREVYAWCRRTLAAELDAEPAPETMAVLQQADRFN